MSNPKKQHYVPQTYLNSFANDSGFIHIYDLVEDKFTKQKPASTGYSKHFYTVEVNGEKDYSIEKMLADHVDSLYLPVIKKISNQEILTKQDKENLSVFVAFQYLRTPAQRKNYNKSVDDGYKQISKIVFQMKKVHGLLSEYNESEIERLGETIDKEDYEIEVPKEHSLEFMLNFSAKMSHMLTHHNFGIIKASSKSEFITSDNPYCMLKESWSPNWSGYGVANTTKIFPLTPKYLLVLKDIGDKIVYMPTGKANVRSMNLLIASWADRFIYSKNEFLLRSLMSKIKKQANEK